MFSFLTSYAFTIPESGVSDIFVVARGIFEDFLPLFLVLLGIYFGFRIIRLILEIFFVGRAGKAGQYHEFREGRPTGRGRYYEEGERFDDDDDEEEDEEDEDYE